MWLDNDMPATTNHNTGTAGERGADMAAHNTQVGDIVDVQIVAFATTATTWSTEANGFHTTHGIVRQVFAHQIMVELVRPPLPYEAGEVLVLDNERIAA
jgi:hypothetical protein